MSTRKGAAHAINIMAMLAESRRAMTAYELLDGLRPTGVSAPLTVYRALDKLMEAGKVHRIESLNAFVACRDSHQHPHNHGHAHDRTVGFAICDRCGAVEEFVDRDLHTRLDADLAAKGFAPRSSFIEVLGLCAACSVAPQSSVPQ
jgi:Fur family zinc uptake transcriptional regulator